MLSWSDGLNRCLNEPLLGSYMEIHSLKELTNLENIHEINSFWLGATNFGSCTYSIRQVLRRKMRLLKGEKKRVIT